MGFIGDLERLLAELWPFRIPIAIAIVVLAAIFLYVAWRRDWYRVVRVHPRASAAVVVVLLIVAIPTAWILGSPLFIRTELNEAPPVVAVAETGEDGAAAGWVVLSGTWEGADDFHFGEGNAEINEVEPGRYVLSLSEFSVQNGPDLFVYVSPDANGWAPDAVNLGELKATDGAFSYEIPADVDIEDIASAVVWCRAFSVLFATATLEPTSA